MTSIMQNKANFKISKMNVSSILTKDYENEPRLLAPGKQSQSKPISKAGKCRCVNMGNVFKVK